MSGLGYSQSWTVSNGSGEIYISKLEKQLLGRGNSIGSILLLKRLETNEGQQLVVEKVTGYDPLGHPITEEELEDVNDVLVGNPSADDITNSLQLYGKRIDYVIGIPKGDTHNWTDAKLYIWGELYMTIGFPETGIQENIPLRWGQNVKVQRYG